MSRDSVLASVIVLGRNDRRYIDGCFDSLLDQDLPRHQYEIIYADDKSTDGSLEYVREKYSQVRRISFGEQLGFAKGYNEAIGDAAGRYLFILNLDTVVHRSWLRVMLDTMQSDSKLGACHSNQIMPWHDDFSSLDRHRNPGSIYMPELTRNGYVMYHQMPMQSSVVPTAFLSAACCVVDRKILGRLRYLFDGRFFMYAEDLDLALRIRALGYDIALVPQAVVYHFHYGGSKWGFRQVRIAYLDTRNRILAYYKTVPNTEFVRLLPRLLLGAPLKVFQLGQNRLFQIIAFFAMIPIVFAAALASLTMMHHYSSERAYWLENRARHEASVGRGDEA